MRFSATSEGLRPEALTSSRNLSMLIVPAVPCRAIRRPKRIDVSLLSAILQLCLSLHSPGASTSFACNPLLGLVSALSRLYAQRVAFTTRTQPSNHHHPHTSLTASFSAAPPAAAASSCRRRRCRPPQPLLLPPAQPRPPCTPPCAPSPSSTPAWSTRLRKSTPCGSLSEGAGGARAVGHVSRQFSQAQAKRDEQEGRKGRGPQPAALTGAEAQLHRGAAGLSLLLPLAPPAAPAGLLLRLRTPLGPAPTTAADAHA